MHTPHMEHNISLDLILHPMHIKQAVLTRPIGVLPLLGVVLHHPGARHLLKIGVRLLLGVSPIPTPPPGAVILPGPLPLLMALHLGERNPLAVGMLHHQVVLHLLRLLTLLDLGTSIMVRCKEAKVQRLLCDEPHPQHHHLHLPLNHLLWIQWLLQGKKKSKL